MAKALELAYAHLEEERHYILGLKKHLMEGLKKFILNYISMVVVVKLIKALILY